jgi:hypothetical protein
MKQSSQREFTKNLIPPKKKQKDSVYTLKPRLNKRLILRMRSQQWEVIKEENYSSTSESIQQT